MGKRTLKTIKKLTENEEKYENLETIINNYVQQYSFTLEQLGYKETLKEEVKNFKNFTDKLAIWYELKFPDPKVISIFQNEDIKLDEEFFNKSLDPIYNTHIFINSYLYNEKYFLDKPVYPDVIYLNENTYLKLTRKGIIKKAKGFILNGKDFSKIFEGINIKNLLSVAINENFPIKEQKIIANTIKEYYFKIKAKEILLDITLHKILKRGDKNIGSKRAILFAKEFKRNIDIAMKYAISTNDQNTKNIIKYYLKNNGNKNLEIIVDFYNIEKKMTLEQFMYILYTNDIELKEYINITKKLQLNK